MSPSFYTWTPVIISHAAMAGVAVILGGFLLWGAKGTRMHRIGGWIWVLAMTYVAGVSFRIHHPEGFSWIHGLSAFTLGALGLGVWFARKHWVQAHRLQMISLYAGALVITGFFTLLPGRLIGNALWNWLGFL